jgi:hypothetical protein
MQRAPRRRIVKGEIDQVHKPRSGRTSGGPENRAEVGVPVRTCQQAGGVIDLFEHAVDDVTGSVVDQKEVVKTEFSLVIAQNGMEAPVDAAVAPPVARVVQIILRSCGLGVAGDIEILQDGSLIRFVRVGITPLSRCHMVAQPGLELDLIIREHGPPVRVQVPIGQPVFRLDSVEGLPELQHGLNDGRIFGKRGNLMPGFAKIGLDLPFFWVSRTAVSWSKAAFSNDCLAVL